MSDSFLVAIKVLSVAFLALLVIPLFIPAGRRERGYIYAAELALVLFGWYRIRNADAVLLGRILWQPKEVDYLRAFLLGMAAATTLVLLYQFIPRKNSEKT